MKYPVTSCIHYHGSKLIMGTEHPIVSYVRPERNRYGKIIGYIATYNLCNGVPTHAQRFKTKGEAIASIGE